MHYHHMGKNDGGDAIMFRNKRRGRLKPNTLEKRGENAMAVTANRIHPIGEVKNPKSHWTALARDCRAINKEMGWTKEDHQRMLEKARRMIDENSR